MFSSYSLDKKANLENESNSSWEARLTSTCDDVLKHLSVTQRRQGKILNRIAATCKALQKTKEKNSDVILEILNLKNEQSGIGEAIEDSARDLYLIEEYREAMSNRISSISAKSMVKNQDHYEAEKAVISELLRESNRCILAERMALSEFKTALTQPQQNHQSSLGSFTKFSTKKSSKEWDMGMKRAQWIESHNQVERVLSKLTDRFSKLEINRSQQIRQDMKSYIEVRMIFHAKALELLTSSFKKVNKTSDEWAAIDGEDCEKAKTSVGLTQLVEACERFKVQGIHLCNDTGVTSRLSLSPPKISQSKSSHSSQKHKEVEDEESKFSPADEYPKQVDFEYDEGGFEDTNFDENQSDQSSRDIRL